MHRAPPSSAVSRRGGPSMRPAGSPSRGPARPGTAAPPASARSAAGSAPGADRPARRSRGRPRPAARSVAVAGPPAASAARMARRLGSARATNTCSAIAWPSFGSGGIEVGDQVAQLARPAVGVAVVGRAVGVVGQLGEAGLDDGQPRPRADRFERELDVGAARVIVGQTVDVPGEAELPNQVPRPSAVVSAAHTAAWGRAISTVRSMRSGNAMPASSVATHRLLLTLWQPLSCVKRKGGGSGSRSRGCRGVRPPSAFTSLRQRT